MTVWMKVWGERGTSTLYIGCVYMPTDSTSVAVVESCYGRHKEDVLCFIEKGQVVLLGDFNAHVGRSVDLDGVIGMFGEDTCNAGGNRLISFLNEIVCNGRKLVVEPEWTRVGPSLKAEVHNRLCHNRCSANGSIRECACRHYRYRMFRPISSMGGIR